MSNEELGLIIGGGQLLFAFLLWLGWDMKGIRERFPKLPQGRRPKLLLILIVGGFLFTGYGFYQNHVKSLVVHFKQPYSFIEIRDRTFENEAVMLDGYRYA